MYNVPSQFNKNLLKNNETYFMIQSYQSYETYTLFWNFIKIITQKKIH